MELGSALKCVITIYIGEEDARLPFHCSKRVCSECDVEFLLQVFSVRSPTDSG